MPLMDSNDIRGLSDEAKRALLQKLLQEQAAKSARRVPPLEPAPRDGDLPASLAQEGQWFFQRVQPDSPAFNVPGALRLSGPLDVAALERGLTEVCRRHEVLRTTFPEREGRPVQRIAEPAPVPLPVVDLSSLPEAQRQEELRRRMEAEARQPFQLEAGPLLRAILVRLAPEEHVLLLTVHHIVTDGFSQRLLSSELFQLYEAFRDGKPSPLPEQKLQYADHAVWQRSWLKGEALQAQLGWWRKRLEHVPVLELRTDRPRKQEGRAPGALSTEVRLPPALCEALRRLAQQEGATPFMLLQAGFFALLHRYTGSTDIAVGTTVAGRHRKELESIQGLFFNTLVLRESVEARETFRALLARVRQGVLGAYAHQEVPFELLVQELKPARHVGRTPFFQVLFDLQEAPRPVRTAGLELRPWQPHTGTAKFDLAFAVQEDDAGLSAVAEYNAHLFDAATIERMLGHYVRLLEGAVAHPETRVDALPLLSEAERRQLLVDWNATAREVTGEQCLHRLVEAQVARSPDAIAASFEGETLTYRDLNGRANQLAHHLRRLGIGPEVRVGLCMERSLELLVGVLGILKAGGTYVPLDPTLPLERLDFVLEDTLAPVLLTQQHLADELALRAPYTLCLDTGWDAISGESEEELPGGAVPENAAYVIYTSGSTGKPKGVMVPHRGACNTIRATAEDCGLAVGQRLLQFLSIGFDVCVGEFFSVLSSGATLVLVRRESLIPGPGLLRILQEERITVAMIPVSALAALPEGELPRLRVLITGGEVCPQYIVDRWAKGRRFYNMYGPTEVTITATRAPCAPGEHGPTIGRPLANIRTYVLDARGEPVPLGVVGELYLGGVGVTRGYLGRPELTAERFVPDAFSGVPGERLYRTGDQVWQRADGRLEFVGRADEQVKVRGFRIELGEVEAALQRQPGVELAVVVVREVSPGDKRLVGYVVAPGVATGTLLQGLRLVLPEYMVPGTLVAMESLPVTANGKVDRAALPAPESVRSDGFGDEDAPRTPLEARVAQLWADVLGLKRVGRHEDFFDLGGHSLLLGLLASRLQEAFGVELKMEVLFTLRTVESQAARVAELLPEAGREQGPEGARVTLQAGGSQTPVFFVHPLTGGATSFSLLAGLLGKDVPVHALRAPELFSDQTFDSVEERAACYLEAVRQTQPHGPYRLCGYSAGGIIAFEMARQLREQGEEVELLALIDTRTALCDPTSPLASDGGPNLGDLEFLGTVLNTDPSAFMQLPTEEEREALAIGLMSAHGLLSTSATGAQVRRAIRGMRSVVRTVSHYQLRPWSQPLTLVTAEETAAEGDARLGWEHLCSALDVQVIPGSHDGIVRPPHVRELARVLGERLARLAPRRTSGALS